MKPQFIVFSLAFFTFSCNPYDRDIKQKLIGEWENISFKVTMKTFQNLDSTNYFRVDSGDWVKKLNIKSIKTTYSLDSGYISIYKNSENEIVNRSTGIWYVKNDSLYLKADGILYMYKVLFDGSKARFISNLDWDQDGKEDDIYDGWQQKLKPN